MEMKFKPPLTLSQWNDWLWNHPEECAKHHWKFVDVQRTFPALQWVEHMPTQHLPAVQKLTPIENRLAADSFPTDVSIMPPVVQPWQKVRRPRVVVRRSFWRKVQLTWLLIVQPDAARISMRLDRIAAERLAGIRRDSHFLLDRKE